MLRFFSFDFIAAIEMLRFLASILSQLLEMLRFFLSLPLAASENIHSTRSRARVVLGFLSLDGDSGKCRRETSSDPASAVIQYLSPCCLALLLLAGYANPAPLLPGVCLVFMPDSHILMVLRSPQGEARDAFLPGGDSP